MRIAIVGPSYPFRGGISTYTTLLARKLKSRHEVLFVSFSRQYPKTLFPGKNQEDLSNVSLKEPGTERTLDSMNPLTWLRVARRIASWNPDMVVFPWWVSFWAPQFYTIIRRLRKLAPNAKIMFVCHNVVSHESNFIHEHVTRFVLGRADMCEIHSQEDQKKFDKLLPSHRSFRGFLPYDDAKPQLVDQKLAKKKLGLGDTKPTILFFGIIRPYKGLGWLLKAMPRVIKETGATLLVVGESWGGGAEYAKISQELQLSEHVRFVNSFVPDAEMPTYFSASDLVVLPYETATGSAVLATCMKYGRPVVATRVGSFPEIIKDGISGHLVPPRNSDALASAIIKSLQTAELSRLRAEFVADRKRYTWDRLIDEMEGQIVY